MRIINYTFFLSILLLSNSVLGLNGFDSPEELKVKLSKATQPAQQYNMLMIMSEHGSDAKPVLKTVAKFIDSPEPMVKAAALNVFISAMQPYPDIVPQLVKLAKKYPRNGTQRRLRGFAVAALAEVCNDPEVFRKLLKRADKSLKMTIAVALQDKPTLKDALGSELEWPHPEISGRNKSVLINGGFEQNQGSTPTGWELVLKDGAAGKYSVDTTRSYSGKQSLLLQKNNGKGYLELKSKSMVTVPAKAFWTWRGFYYAETAPPGTLLQFRLEDENGKVSSHDNVPRAGWAWQSQSFLLNSSGKEWRKRLLMLRPASKERKFRMIIRIYGNPCKVWLDNLTFPSPAWRMHITSAVPEAPRYTWEEAAKILAERKNTIADLKQAANKRIELRLNGKTVAPVLYFPWRSEYGDFQKFDKNGIKIHNIVLPINDYYGEFKSGKYKDIGLGPVWPSAKSEKYNFKPLFAKLRAYLRKDPHGYIMLGFHITWPKDYVKVNPDTAWQNRKGHYAYGAPSFMFGFKPASQIKAPLLRWPSPYSDKPFEDVSKVLKAFAKELQKTDMAKAIIGCFVCGGHDGQFEVLRRDFSNNGKTAWRKWLREKYKNDSSLQAAWSDKNATIANAPVPVNSYGRPKTANGSMVFYSPATERADRDYSLFRQERIWHLKEYLIKSIKGEFKKPLLGAVWLMGGAAKYTSPFLHSKDLDIAIIQPAYQHRMPGMMTGSSIPFESLRTHRKMIFKELDFRTWIRETYHSELGSMKIGTPMNLEAFKSANRKEIGQMIANGAGGWWYYDISENAFNHPDLLKEIKQSTSIAKWVDANAKKFQPEVAVVLNHSAPLTTRMNIWRFRNETSWLMGYQMYALKMSGVPFDIMYFEDVKKNPELQKYRMYIFLNAYELEKSDINFINKKLKRNNNTLVWHFAPGYLNTEQRKYDVNQVATMTGMKVKTSMSPKNFRVYAAPESGLLPLQGLGDVVRTFFSISFEDKFLNTQRFAITDNQVTRLASYADDGTTAIAMKKMKNWTSVYAASLSGISGELFHKLAKEQKLYTVCSPNIAQIEMNGSFISISPLMNGKLKLKLPRKCTVVDAFSNEILAKDCNTYQLTVKPGKTIWLLLK